MEVTTEAGVKLREGTKILVEESKETKNLGGVYFFDLIIESPVDTERLSIAQHLDLEDLPEFTTSSLPLDKGQAKEVIFHPTATFDRLIKVSVSIFRNEYVRFILTYGDYRGVVDADLERMRSFFDIQTV